MVCPTNIVRLLKHAQCFKVLGGIGLCKRTYMSGEISQSASFDAGNHPACIMSITWQRADPHDEVASDFYYIVGYSVVSFTTDNFYTVSVDENHHIIITTTGSRGAVIRIIELQ